MSLPRFFAPDATDGASVVRLPEVEAHHLQHVRRLDTGADVAVFDGRGHEWLGRITTVARNQVAVELVEPRLAVAEPPARVILAIALLKGDQMDAVVRDATALGAAVIVPMTSAHSSVPRAAWKSGAAIDRWQRVAVASAKQCGRAVVPELRAVSSFDDVLRDTARDLVLMCVEPAQAVAARDVPEHAAGTTLLIVGPEGGWSSEEIEQAARAQTRWLSLGPRTLRAETAPVVALSALWARWGWTTRPV